jgi:hypothetical protein
MILTSFSRETRLQEASRTLILPGMVAYICNARYLGVRDQEDCSVRSAWANSSRDPHLQNNQSKIDWRCGSSGECLLYKCQALSAKTSPTKRKKRTPILALRTECRFARSRSEVKELLVVWSLGLGFPSSHSGSVACYVSSAKFLHLSVLVSSSVNRAKRLCFIWVGGGTGVWTRLHACHAGSLLLETGFQSENNNLSIHDHERVAGAYMI